MKGLLGVLVILLTAPSGAQTHVRFTATVRWPGSFEHPIRPGLVFTMEPLDGEWRLGVTPAATIKENPDENYAECIGGPLHGSTDLDLLPWQWAPTAPKGYDRHVPGVLQFGFVLDEDSQKYACAEAATVAEDVREGKDDIGSSGYKPRPQGTVRVTVLGFHLQPDPSGHGVLFRDVTVAIDITVPPQKEKRPQ